MQQISSKLIETLKRHEGLRLKPYRCPAGKLTIGVGRNLEDMGISEDEADFLLYNDISRVIEELKHKFTWFLNLSIPRQEALVDLCFNLGMNRLLGFKNFLLAMSFQNYQSAFSELMHSKYAQQVGKRAEEIATQILKGEYEN